MTETMLDVRGIRKSFGALEVLKGIDLTVRKGQIVALIGPSGSGKSTLLRSLNMLETVNEGEIWLDGRLVNRRMPGKAFEIHLNRVRQQMGMVFQHFNLFPHMTILKNVTIAPRVLKGLSEDQSRRQGLDLLAKVGLESKCDCYPSQLSGGQKQRVAIARSLAMQPKVMLFDEATSALDPELVEEVNLVMKHLAAEHMTMLIVTHEMKFAAEVADRVLFMDGGMVVEDSPPDQMFTAPKQERTRSFLRKYLNG